MDKWLQFERGDITYWRDRFERWSRTALWSDGAIVMSLLLLIILVAK